MNCFQIGDEVRVAGLVNSQWRGVQGTIVEIVVSHEDMKQIQECAVEVAGGQRRWFLADHLVNAVPARLVRFFRSEVLARWLLNPDDVALLNGDCGQLVAMLEDRYDFSRRRAEAEVHDFLSAFHERINRATATQPNTVSDETCNTDVSPASSLRYATPAA